MMPNGIDRHEQRSRGNAHVDRALQNAVEPAQGNIIQADDRYAVEVFQPRAQRDELQQVGDDVDLNRLAVGRLDDAEHFDVLFERERDVDVIDGFLADDLVRLSQRAEERQAAIPDVIAIGAVVQKPDDLEAQLAVFQDLVGDQLSQVAGTGNEHALEADACLPSPLERFPHELARGVRKHDVEQQVQRPNDLGHLVHAGVLQAVGHVVGVVVQRAADAEHHREDAADEHREEVVDPGTASPQVIQTLDVEGDRQDHHHERQQLAVILERGGALGYRDHVGQPVEPEHVSQRKRHGTDERVAGDEEEHEEPVIPAHHRGISAALSPSAARDARPDAARLSLTAA